MKKLTALIIAVCMLASLFVTVFADDARLGASVSAILVSPSDDGEITRGEAVVAEAKVSGTRDTDKVRFKMNEAVIKTFGSGEDFNCKVLGLDEGSFVFAVEVVNSAGTVLASDTATLGVAANAGPEVEVPIIEEDANLSPAELQRVEIKVEDTDGIGSVELWLNGKTAELSDEGDAITADLTNISVAGLNTLKIRAKDTFGAQTVYTRKFTADKTKPAFLKLGMDDISSPPSSITKYNGGGNWRVTSGTGKNGSKALEYDLVNNNGGDPANLGVYIPDAHGKFCFMTSVSLGANADFRVVVRGKDKKDYALCSFTTDGALTFGGDGGSITEGLTYTPGEWYDIKIDADTEMGMFDVYINGNPVAIGRNISFGANGVEYFKWRLYTVNVTAYIDNVELTAANPLPAIKEIYSGDKGTLPGGGDYTVSVALSASVTDDDSLAGSISLTNDAGRAEIDSVSYDAAANVITVNTLKPLLPGMTYTLTLGKDICIKPEANKLPAMSLGVDLVAEFATAPAELDIKSAGFDIKNGMLCFDAELVNTSGTDEDVVCVMYMWEGDELVGIYAGRVLASDTDAYCSAVGSAYLEGQRAEAYVFKGDLASPVSVKCFSFEG